MNTYEIFAALAEPTRYEIVEMLATNGDLSASSIFDKFKVSKPAISQHLKVLREANIVKVEKKAQQRIYQLNPEAMGDVEVWVKRMTKLWNDRFDRLDAVLKSLQIEQNKK